MNNNWNTSKKHEQLQPCDRYVRERECKKLTSLSRQYRWQLEKEGRFPKRIKLGKKIVAWRYSEIQEWIKKGPPEQ